MAAPTFGAAGTYLTGTTSGTANVAVPSGVANLDIVLIFLYIESATAPTAIPSGFAEIPTALFTVGTVVGERAYWKRATGADAGTYNFTLSGTPYRSAVAIRCPGVITVGTPYDTGAGAPNNAVRSSNATATPAVALTTQGADRLLVWSTASTGVGTWTPPAGYTERLDAVDLTVGTVAKATAGATGSVTGTGPSGFHASWLIALLPVPAAQTINAGTVAAPAVPFQPALDQTWRIFPNAVAAPSAPPNPQVIPGAVTIFPAAIAAPSLPAPKLQQVIRPAATPSVSVVYPPTIEVGPRPRLRVDFWALDDDGSVLCPLPHPISWDLSLVPGEPGAVKLEYPAAGLNYDVLHARVSRTRDLRIKVRWNGRHDEALGALLYAREGDDVTEGGTVTFYGRFLTWLLAEAPLPYNTGAEKGEWTYVDGTAGSILNDVLDTVQGDGYLDGATWLFEDTVDSTGALWTTQTSATFPPGRTVLQVAQQLRKWGMLEFEVVDDEDGNVVVRAFEPTATGTDHTVSDPPLVLRRGRDLTDAPRRVDVSDAATSLLVAGKGGVYVEVDDPTAIAERGRKIGQYLSEGNLTTTGAATAYGTLELSRRTEGVDEITHSLVFDQDQVLPLRDIKPLDWVYSDLLDGEGIGTRERVAQITISQPANSDHYRGGVVLRDLITSRDQSVQRELDGLAGGQIVTGVSQSTAQTDDGKAPGQVVGLAVASGAYPVQDGTRAAVTATWVELTDNFDGSPMLDFDYYEIQFRYTSGSLPTDWQALPAVRDETASWDGVVAGVLIQVRVRAIDRFCRPGAWSAVEDHVTDDDATPPPVPSTPDVSSYLGILTIEWDGLGSAGEGMPPDFDRVDVYASTTSGFTPSSGTYIDSLRGAGVMPSTIGNYGETWYARLVSVDKSGNASAASAQDSALLEQASDGDIGAVSIGKLTAGIMSALMTISGIIRTASSGARVELDTTGLRCYSSTGVVLFEFNIPSSALSLVGKLTSGLGVGTGRTIVVDPNGDGSEPAIVLYPNATAQRVRMRAMNDVTPESGSAPQLIVELLNAAGTPDGGTLQMWDNGAALYSRNAAGVTAAGGEVVLTDNQIYLHCDGGYVQLQDGDIFLDAAAGRSIISTVAQGTTGAGFSQRLQSGNTAGVRGYYDSGTGTMRFVDNQSGGTWMKLGDGGGAYKNFVLPHPVDPDRLLVHVCTETPDPRVQYEGVATLRGGRAEVELPSYFEALCREDGRTVQATMLLPDEPLREVAAGPPPPEPRPPFAWEPPGQDVVREEPDLVYAVAASLPLDGRFRLASPAPDGTRAAWVVSAIRRGPALDVEPLRAETTVRGEGPYTWVDVPGTRD